MPTTTKKPIEYLHLHLLKKEIIDPASAIREGKSRPPLKSTTSVLSGGILYFASPPSTPAVWRNFLLPAFGNRLPDFRSQHASAVLLFPAAKRWFALTYGYGKSMLAEGCLEPDFGLKTAVQLHKPDSLRAVQYRTVEEKTRIGRVQMSDESAVGAFRLDTDTDLLRGLEVGSNDTSVCERLAANWASLTVGARVDLSGLPTLVGKLLKYYSKQKLPPEFEFIDHMQRIIDPPLLLALDTELESRLDSAKYDGIRLAMPELADGVIGMDAKFFKADGPAFESSIAAYLKARNKAVTSTLGAAKSAHRIVMVDESTGKVKSQKDVYRCIIAEIEYNKELYLLADGEWFALDKDFVAKVNKAMSKIPVLKPGWPAWKPGEAEGKYNKRVQKLLKGSTLLDAKNISYGGGRSKIEAADLLTKTRILCHAKRMDQGNQSLSHLFAQGAVASTAISQSHEFRKKVVQHVKPENAALATELGKLKFDPKGWTVAYVLLGADPEKPTDSLPFFAKVNLKKHIERLLAMQYKVGIIGV